VIEQILILVTYYEVVISLKRN